MWNLFFNQQNTPTDHGFKHELQCALNKRKNELKHIPPMPILAFESYFIRFKKRTSYLIGKIKQLPCLEKRVHAIILMDEILRAAPIVFHSFYIHRCGDFPITALKKIIEFHQQHDLHLYWHYKFLRRYVECDLSLIHI